MNARVSGSLEAAGLRRTKTRIAGLPVVREVPVQVHPTGVAAGAQFGAVGLMVRIVHTAVFLRGLSLRT